MEVEDEEAAVGEVAVELEQDAVAGAVRRFQGRVPAEDAELRGALVRPVPAERGVCLAKALAAADASHALCGQQGLSRGRKAGLSPGPRGHGWRHTWKGRPAPQPALSGRLTDVVARIPVPATPLVSFPPKVRILKPKSLVRLNRG